MKNTRLKKSKSNKKFIIASAGKSVEAPKSVALHANLADSNSSQALTAHYKELIGNGLVADKVELVVTDMLPAYDSVISTLFVNALHQFCIFHLIQSINKALKEALKEHRTANYPKKERKEAHLISFLMLRGEEKLSDTEREKVLLFCEKHPEATPNYALKEDIRVLYATAKNPAQAYAYRDVLDESYATKIAEPMKKVWTFLKDNFEKTIAYLRKDYPADKTNNDAERMMRMIKRTQQTHYFLRNTDNYIKKVKVVLGIQTPVAT
jgi:transposase